MTETRNTMSFGLGSFGEPERELTEDEKAYYAAREQAMLDVLRLQSNMQFNLPDGQNAGYLHWQVGPLSEGRNGMLLDEVIELLIDRVEFLQRVSSSRENSIIITHLEEAWNWIQRRQTLRERQGVVGTMASHWSTGQSKSLEDYGYVNPTLPESWQEPRESVPTGFFGHAVPETETMPEADIEATNALVEDPESTPPGEADFIAEVSAAVEEAHDEPASVDEGPSTPTEPSVDESGFITGGVFGNTATATSEITGDANADGA